MVTERYDANRQNGVTQPYEPGSGPSPCGVVPEPDQLIDDRYRIEEGPIGEATGEGAVYVSSDAMGRQLAIKVYHAGSRARPEVVQPLLGLCHQNIVNLLAVGQWQGHWYEAMELCAGGSLTARAPLDEGNLTTYLAQIVDGLHYLHGQGVIHRDIKPNNLLLRDSDGRDLVISDFGISSWTDGDPSGHRQTQTYRFTPDYLAPEFPEVSDKTDYYALGITLLHLLQGASPFANEHPHVIHVAHLYGEIPLPESISAAFKHLVVGLLQREPGNRWGYSQVLSWLHDEPIVDDYGRHWQPERVGIRQHPYPGYLQAKTPAELAVNLDKFDARRQLFTSGDLRRWAFHDLKDAELADVIDRISDDYTDRQELGLFKLKYALDPNSPLTIGVQEVRTLDQLADLLASDDEAILLALERALWGEWLETWIDAARPHERSDELAREIADIRQRLTNQHRRLALFAVLIVLVPAHPLQLGPGCALTDPEDIETLLSVHPQAQQWLQTAILDRRFEEWLRGNRPTAAADVAAARSRCRADTQLLVCAVRWRLNAQAPFAFGSVEVTDPGELARLITENNHSLTLGSVLLQKGWIREWLTAIGRLSDPAAFDAIVDKQTMPWAAKLEAILPLLDGRVPRPQIVSSTTEVALGDLARDQVFTIRLDVRNAARGFLWGTVSLKDGTQGVVVEPTQVQGDTTAITLRVETRGMPLRTQAVNTLLLTTNGGNLAIPISFRVVAPIRRIVGRSLLAGCTFGSLLGLYRSGLATSGIYGSPPHGALEWISLSDLMSDTPLGIPLDGALLSGLLLVLIVTVCGYALLRVRKRGE